MQLRERSFTSYVHHTPEVYFGQYNSTYWMSGSIFILRGVNVRLSPSISPFFRKNGEIVNNCVQNQQNYLFFRKIYLKGGVYKYSMVNV